MRLFVAIELGDPLIRSLVARIDRLRHEIEQAWPRLPVRWVGASNLHITLVFLGEVGEESSLAVRAALDRPIAVAPFELTLAGLGIFPSSGPLRVVWMGVAQGAEPARVIHAEVARRLAPLDYRPESRPYTPHLTIARVKDARGPGARQARELVRRFPAGGGVTRVESVTLFRSHLSPRGSTYEPLLRVPLEE
jgi:2'-5' RNA ligase